MGGVGAVQQGVAMQKNPHVFQLTTFPCIQIDPKWTNSREVWPGNTQGWGGSAGGTVTSSHPGRTASRVPLWILLVQIWDAPCKADRPRKQERIQQR